MNLIPQSYWKYSECYTIEHFNTHLDMKALLFGLTMKNIFSRGLARMVTLQKLEINKVFKTLLSKIRLNWIRPAKFLVSSLALNKVGSTKSLLTSTHRINPTCLLHPSTTDILSISFSLEDRIGDFDISSLLLR